MIDSSSDSRFLQRAVQSPLIACICGSFLLWISFGIRQTFGVYLIPVTKETGWDRSTFSIAAALMQLLWGFGQPFVVYLAERKVGFGKTIFLCSIVYAIGCFLLFGSEHSSGLFIFGMGAVIGLGAGGNSFPIILATVGRRFKRNSNYQSMAFGIVSSFGSFGQCCFLPIARAMISSLGWRMSFVVCGVVMVALAPLAFFLQTISPKSLECDTIEEIAIEKSGVANKDMIIDEKDKPIQDNSAPNIKTALIEAFSSPVFICITLGFSVCGFHITFISTHFPAFLQDQGINSSLAAWTISILGLGSMIGAIVVGYLLTMIQSHIILMGIYTIRAALFLVILFVPTSVTTTILFSVLFGPLWLSTVPCTTKFIGDKFGQKYLGTLSSISFTGHQIGAFLGAYVGGVVYDREHDYSHMWYGALAMAIFAILVNFLAGWTTLWGGGNSMRNRVQN